MVRDPDSRVYKDEKIIFSTFQIIFSTFLNDINWIHTRTTDSEMLEGRLFRQTRRKNAHINIKTCVIFRFVLTLVFKLELDQTAPPTPVLANQTLEPTRLWRGYTPSPILSC